MFDIREGQIAKLIKNQQVSGMIRMGISWEELCRERNGVREYPAEVLAYKPFLQLTGGKLVRDGDNLHLLS